MTKRVAEHGINAALDRIDARLDKMVTKRQAIRAALIFLAICFFVVLPLIYWMMLP